MFLGFIPGKLQLKNDQIDGFFKNGKMERFFSQSPISHSLIAEFSKNAAT